VTVPRGATVSWVNTGQSYSHTFDTSGQYTYFCIPHEALGMVGQVTVSS
jgi:plastocyanin